MSEFHTITIRLTPNARQNAILGWEEDLLGERLLKVQVTVVPEKGKANKALIALLSKHWKIPKSAIRIVRGETSRTKTLEVKGLDDSALS
ncbi:MAG: hypothetical protein CMH26_10040 [Micavibrio sp.]|nr:hypothetical protein [Micavibrio sp.]|tara:strand:- start:136 stop:405 length:270 start_codon:yes stop_codon:yes gene_type:complete